jgi:outer membrane protein assembly factor BamE (lipoprotein component of BamABCDE complex)
MQIAAGTNQDAVRSQLGEPVKVATYLFAPGKTWFYYVKGGIPGNEKLVQVDFDEQGNAQSTKLVDATFYDMNRWD